MKPERVGADDIFERDLYVWELPSAGDWPVAEPFLAEHFGLLLACDARALADDAIRALAAGALDQGLVYLCCWGPDCKRVHDLFDEEIAGRGRARGEGLILTSWHDEPLEEAAAFFCDTQPAMLYENSATAWVALSVGNPEWTERLRRRLAVRATS